MVNMNGDQLDSSVLAGTSNPLVIPTSSRLTLFHHISTLFDQHGLREIGFMNLHQVRD
jgi:hypothetical protein